MLYNKIFDMPKAYMKISSILNKMVNFYVEEHYSLPRGKWDDLLEYQPPTTDMTSLHQQ